MYTNIDVFKDITIYGEDYPYIAEPNDGSLNELFNINTFKNIAITINTYEEDSEPDVILMNYYPYGPDIMRVEICYKETTNEFTYNIFPAICLNGLIVECYSIPTFCSGKIHEISSFTEGFRKLREKFTNNVKEHYLKNTYYEDKRLWDYSIVLEDGCQMSRTYKHNELVLSFKDFEELNKVYTFIFKPDDTTAPLYLNRNLITEDAGFSTIITTL